MQYNVFSLNYKIFLELSYGIFTENGKIEPDSQHFKSNFFKFGQFFRIT